MSSKYKKDKPKNYRKDLKRRMRVAMQHERDMWPQKEDELAEVMMK